MFCTFRSPGAAHCASAAIMAGHRLLKVLSAS